MKPTYEELQAEVTRLQSIIAEAQKQEPYAFASLNGEDFTHHESHTKTFVGHGWIPLYAAPVPVQQLQAVPVWQIDFNVELPVIREILKKVGNKVEAGITRQALDYINALHKERDALRVIINCNAQSPRITEQDAREIADSVFRYCKETPTWYIDNWFAYIGKELLEKLNKNLKEIE